MFLREFEEYSDLFANDPEPPPSDCYNNDTYGKMTQQMWDLYKAYKQTANEFNEKIRLCKRYNNWIQKDLPGYNLVITGSTLNGFGLKNSDVDLVLLKSRKSNSIESAEYIFEEVLTCLRKYGISGRLIPSNVPIIKLKDDESNLDVDISYNNVNAIRNTQLLYRYSKVDWRVRPLCVILKLWTKHREINDASSGTLSSYAWMLMMLHYLQAGVQPAVLPCLSIDQADRDLTSVDFFTKDDIRDHRFISTSENIDSIGKLFAGFLLYYKTFKCSSYVISIREGKTLPIRRYRKNNKKSCQADSFKTDKYLFIEDPFTLNNLAITVLSLRKFRKIRKYGVTKYYKKLLKKKFNLSSILKI